MKIISHERGKDAHFKLWHALPDGENMIIYMYSDGGSIVCRERIYPIKRGALCFIGAGKYHYTMPNDPSLYDRTKIFFPSELLRGVISLISDGRDFSGFAWDSIVYAEIKESERKYVDSIFESLAKSVESPHGRAEAVSSLIRLLHLIEENSIDGASSDSGSLGGAIDYINKNIFREISIDEICAAVHISKYHFCRRFKETMSMTVMEYVLKTRIVLAKNMLEKENASISEISDRCGFSSVSYFCRVFKESVGVSPLKYRKSFD